MATFLPTEAYVWFAWRPVRLAHGGYAWLKRVSRRQLPSHTKPDGSVVCQWLYSRLGYDPGPLPRFKDAEAQLRAELEHQRAMLDAIAEQVEALQKQNSRLQVQLAAADREIDRLLDKYSYQEFGELRVLSQPIDSTPRSLS